MSDKYIKEAIEKDGRLYNKYYLNKIEEYSAHIGFVIGLIIFNFLCIFLFFGESVIKYFEIIISYFISLTLYLILSFVIALFFYGIIRLSFSTLFLMLFKKKEGLE